MTIKQISSSSLQCNAWACLSSYSAFPTYIFPPDVRRFVQEATRAKGCREDLVGVPMLTATGAAAGNAIRIEIKSDWSESCALFSAVVSDTGTVKTPAMDQTFQPLYQCEREGTERRFFSTDSTTEALAPLLRDNPRGLIVIRDELIGWVRSHNQYKSRGADREFYLSAWSGSPVVVDRKGEHENGPIRVSHPFLALHGNLPLDLLGSLADEQAREDGLMHRLLFAFSEYVEVQDFTYATISDVAQGDWVDTIKKLSALEPASESPWTPLIVPLNDRARRAFEILYNDLCEDLRDPTFPPVLRGPWRKLQTYAARLALIVHLLRWAHGLADLNIVDEKTIARTYVLVFYFQDQARRVYQRMPFDDLDRRAQQALAWIRRQGSSVTARDLQNKHVAGIDNSGTAKAVLQRLADRGIGTVVEGDKGSVIFQLNGHPSEAEVSRQEGDR